MEKNNNKGFSLIELVVVIAILAIAGGLTYNSLSTIYSARSKKAAETVSAVISQSKVNAMSGKKNVMTITFKEDKDPNSGETKEAYFCELHYINANNTVSDEAYETQAVGNDSLRISVNSPTDKNTTYTLIEPEDGSTAVQVDKIEIEFNLDTGAVKRVSVIQGETSTDLINSETTGVKEITFTLNSISNHTITLYKSTGNQTYQ